MLIIPIHSTLVAFVAQPTPWHSFRYNRKNQGRVPFAGATTPMTHKWLISGSAQSASAPVLDDKNVYSTLGVMLASNVAYTGQMNWFLNATGTTWASLFLGSNTIYSYVRNGTAYAINKTDGKVRWSTPINGSMFSYVCHVCDG